MNSTFSKFIACNYVLKKLQINNSTFATDNGLSMISFKKFITHCHIKPTFVKYNALLL